MTTIREVRPRKITFNKCIRYKILSFCHLRTRSPCLASLRWIAWGSESASPQPEPFFRKSIFHCSIVKMTNTHCCVMESTITIKTRRKWLIYLYFRIVDLFLRGIISNKVHILKVKANPPEKNELKIWDRKGFCWNHIQKNSPSAKSQNRNCHYQVNNHKWHFITPFLLIKQIGNVESGIVGTAVLQVN